MARDEAYLEAEKKIEEALKSGTSNLGLRSMKLTELPASLGQLSQLTELNLSDNQLTTLPAPLGQLSQLTELNLSDNQLTTLPASLGQLSQLTELNLSSNQLTALPESLGQLSQLTELNLSDNQMTTLPTWLGKLSQLTGLDLSTNQLTALPESLGQLSQLSKLDLFDNKLTELPTLIVQLITLKELYLHQNLLTTLPEWLERLDQLQVLDIENNQMNVLPDCITRLSQLEELNLGGNPLKDIPNSISKLINLRILRLGCNHANKESIYNDGIPYCISQIKTLQRLNVHMCGLATLPNWISEIHNLEIIFALNNNIVDLPPSLAQLKHLKELELQDNPLNPALQSAYNQGLEAVKAYLRSLEKNTEPLYEAKLVLVGEGNVGKTTLLKALRGGKGKKAPKKGETTTHGVEIDIHGLILPHPKNKKVKIQLNAWDFGGQDVYRVTHQFFFSRRSLYILVWEPRRGIQQGQVEDWLNMIRLRVGGEARVAIVSTHCKTGERIARIDKPVLKQQYGEMIVGFYEVDSLVPDETTGEMVGIAELKKVIAEQAAQLEHMGMLFNNDWKAARDELIAYSEPRISYAAFTEICVRHGLSQIDTDTLAHLMHDLGYIVHYSEDEKLRDDVVLKPQWLTKAIGFVLEDPETAKRGGILLDNHLFKVWHAHTFKNEPRYDPSLYPFFLRLMEKYDVSYRLPDDRKASLVAQHVPQVRPELPWLPEQNLPKKLRRIAMICAMEEDPPGLVPWMIVRTHDYAIEKNNQRLHWQKGMFLNHPPHGEAMLEKRGREFHMYAQAIYPEYFMNVLQETLQKLITDNWPGMEGRYNFSVPCPEIIEDQPCKGRFNIQALRQFLAEGDSTIRCQSCSKRKSIAELLLGFEESPIDVQVREINEKLDGLDSRIANYFKATLRAIADEAKDGPRLFTFRQRDARLVPKQIFSRPLELQLWCEHESHPHPVNEPGKGTYSVDQPRDWVIKIAPYANFVLDVLKTVAPMVAPTINIVKGPKATENWGITDHLDLAKEFIDKLPAEIKTPDGPLTRRSDIVKESQRSGILALHNLLKELDPSQDQIGLHRITTYTGDYRWLCKYHYDAWQPNIPDVIPSHE